MMDREKADQLPMCQVSLGEKLQQFKSPWAIRVSKLMNKLMKKFVSKIKKIKIQGDSLKCHKY